MLKLMLGAIVVHHIRVTPLLGAAHRPREARGTFKVNNPVQYLPGVQLADAPWWEPRGVALYSRELEEDPWRVGFDDIS